ncbi:MAG TPA: hypothetical protein VFU21_26200 [Kofleriaceae bacterium]|nr:hypothetical protein [Kofleriaceae bacterium]
MVTGAKGKAAARPDNPELPAAGLGVHIGFSTTGGWLSRMIRRITGSPVSHSFVVYHSAVFGKDMVLEASGRGFRVMSWRRFDTENKLVAMYRLKVEDAVVHEALGKLADRLGDAYDTLSLFGYLLRTVFRLKRVPFDSRKKLVCSEAVALFLGWCGMPFEDVGVVTPKVLLDLAEERGEVFELVKSGNGFRRVAEKSARRRQRRRRRKRVADPSPVG